MCNLSRFFTDDGTKLFSLTEVFLSHEAGRITSLSCGLKTVRIVFILLLRTGVVNSPLHSIYADPVTTHHEHEEGVILCQLQA